jgi:uncharacterized membrane protein
MSDLPKHSSPADEIRKEFQLERMILFSDAVFAIVITLMAIEIKLPETEGPHSKEQLLQGIRHLLPILLAYIISFWFIGMLWYQHLKLFGYLRSYDKGLVFRNLLLLFCVGLFPFSVSLQVSGYHDSLIPFTVYFCVLLACMLAQVVLSHYVLVSSPHLRIPSDLSDELRELRNKKAGLKGLLACFALSMITYGIIETPEHKGLGTLWFTFMYPAMYLFGYRKKPKTAVR